MTNRLSALTSGTRFGKFVSVGAVGAVFDLSLSSLLIVFFGIAGELAKLAGAELAIVVMFLINDRWTFAGAGADHLTAKVRRFLKSNLVRSGGLAVQVLVVRALGEIPLEIPVAGIDLWKLVPLPIAIGASMLLNYVAESLFTWRIAGRSSQRESR
ncbi:GtrA family protein [Haloferax mediterranei ATCC 33500]|uniref:GtrA family protein n=1 Tax=Haloferax mediterranei (strain ATCC 33500 / DSM 1411 / JCM 8866 / NBRC 14739 / NCIMB 2177 / R-4) TaxID=523841 RepID=I3R2C8_HALMT|nr:GtrA family protein [Haloferax mediterranei]AFK18388.1 GtrA-like family protein, cell surface polysaccharide biosynthesis protein [Haloferax mediterranei ATCC 33500]AHZ22218.1 sugar translocase [Haloferax mediterranei ATCC 33500]EMA02337.1 GtrA-like family protein, cell surface polysaccharide biosynthesis protein [Haloferax mediterranei ATCC 33500]MDX5988480.1 GtrA family protein [Haloferax mediterranei ATCC 33500]QCQ74898.1 GtrA family protein [Haloferax mediterranei ATCC 33500]